MDFILLFLILAMAMVFLISGRMPPDGVGLWVIVALIVTGRATPAEAFMGFGHPATLTVAAVLILSAGAQRTGAIDGVAIWLRRRARDSETRLRQLQTLLVGSVSAFLSNTATVAVFLPVVISTARDRGFSPARFLIPLSFASILGGMCTLIGTSTNIVVASLASEHGLPPMRMFDFAPIGLVQGVLGYLFLAYLAPHLLPARKRGRDMEERYHLRRYLTEVEVLPGSDLVGNSLGSSGLTDRYDLDVIGIHRATRSIEITPGTLLEEHDVLLVRAALDTIRRIQDDPRLQLRPEAKIELSDLVSGGMLLAEALVPPGSPLDGRTLQQTGFRKRYGVTALALFHHREYIQERVGRIRLHIGDMLLLYGSKENLRELAGFSEVVSVVKILPPRPRRSRSRLALVIVAATVGAAASGSVSLEIASVAGAALMVMTGCLNLRETYRAMDRRTILLLAGMISLGLSLERSGAAAYLAESILSGAGSLGPLTLLAATYLATIMITELLTNNACAVIMTPIAIATAEGFGLDPRPFAFAVAYGASASFLTPFGYQTNMFVYGAGGYRFVDFARVGFPLTLITFLVSMLLIPYLWPLTP